MEAISALAAFVLLIALAGILYPFRPFGKRRNALITAGACVALIVAAAPDPNSAQRSSDGHSTTAASTPAATTPQDREAARLAAQRQRMVAQKKKEQAHVAAQENSIQQAVDTFRWGDARAEFENLKSDGNASEDFTAALEKRVLNLVHPLPANKRKANLAGYQLLAALRPENSSYSGKVTSYKKAIEQARQHAVSILRKKVDKVEGITWYEHPNAPRYLNSRSTVYLYIGRKSSGGQPWLRMKVQYTSSDWLFVHSVTAWHDGVKEPLISGNFQRDNNSTIWEWMDVTPSGYQIEVLRSLANAKDAILRFEGQQYHRDVTLSSGDKKALREMLRAYDVMTNNP